MAAPPGAAQRARGIAQAVTLREHWISLGRTEFIQKMRGSSWKRKESTPKALYLGTNIAHLFPGLQKSTAHQANSDTASGWKLRLAFIWYLVKNTKWMVIEVQGPAKFAKDPVLIEKKVTISFMFCLETELKKKYLEVSQQDFPLKFAGFPLGKCPVQQGKFLLFRPYDISIGSGPSTSYGYYGSWMCH